MQNFKKAFLDNYEAISTSEITVSEEKGFVEKLVNKIIQNVQISIESLYIRYEDTFTSTKPFSVGIVIKELKALTCDSSWEPMYIEGGDLNYKLAILNSLRVFMDYGDNYIIDNRIKGDFKSLVAEEMEDNLKHIYILNPTTYTAKITMNTNPKDLSVPQYSINLSNSCVEIGIDSEQIVHTLKILDFLGHFDKFKQGIQQSLNYPELTEEQDIENYRDTYKKYRLSNKDKKNTKEKKILLEIEEKFDVYSLLKHRKIIDKEIELIRKEEGLVNDIKKVESEGQSGALGKLTGFL